MATNRYAQLRRQFLEPLAASRGVRFDFVALFAHGDDVIALGEAEVAFGLLACGADVLLTKTHTDEFPASRRVARKGTKLLTKALGRPASIEASCLLAQSQAVLASEQQRRAGRTDDADVHYACAGLLQRHYPLPAGLIRQLQRERTEAWEHADELRDQAARGEDVPENSAEFIATQRFQQWMTFRALELVLGAWISTNLDDIVLPMVDVEALTRGTADAVSWGHIEQRRMRFVRAARDMALI